MKKLNLILAFCFTLLFAACANPSAVQISPGIYQLGRADHGGIFGNKDALKAGVIRDANTFADGQGKVAIPISAKEHPVGIMGDWATFEYTFRVLGKDDPEAHIPKTLVVSDSQSSPEFRSLGGKDTYYKAETVK